MKPALLIPCAGQGSRFSGPVKKQFSDLNGLPLFLHTLLKFNSFSFIQQKILLIAPEEEAQFRSFLAADFLRARGLPPELGKWQLVPGGAERYLSVQAGLRAVRTDTDYVIIHDAVRPLIAENDLNHIFEILPRKKEGLLACDKVTDTIKVAAEDNTVAENLTRGRLAAASTPQCFPFAEYKEAYQSLDSRAGETVPTDDAEIFLNAGHTVRIYWLEHPNPKVTTETDLALVKLLIANQ